MMVVFFNGNDGVMTDKFVARKAFVCCLCVLDL